MSSLGDESRTFWMTLWISKVESGLSHSLWELMASHSCCLACCSGYSVLRSSSCRCCEDERDTNSASSLLLSCSGVEWVGGCCFVQVHVLIRCHIVLLLRLVLFSVSQSSQALFRILLQGSC